MELTALQQLVHQMYIAYYQRPADPDGLQYWVDQLEQNGDWTAVSAAFGAPENEENQALYGDLNREQTIAAIYQSAFNREAVAEEVAFWAASEFSATDLTFAIVNGAQNSDKATVDNKVAFSAELVAQLETNAAYAELQDPKALLTAVTEETEVTAGYVSDAVASGKVGEAFSLTADVTGETLIGTAGSDTFTGTPDAYDANDAVVDASKADNDTYNLTLEGGATPKVTNIENVNITTSVTNNTNPAIDASSMSGVEVLSVTGGDVMVGGSAIAGDKDIIVNRVDSSKVAKVVSGEGTKDVTINQSAATVSQSKAGVEVDASTATGNVTVTGATTLNADNAASTAGQKVTVTAIDGAAAAENQKAVTINAAKAVDVEVTNNNASVLAGEITINAAAAKEVSVENATGGVTINAAKAADSAGNGIVVAGIDDSGANITTGSFGSLKSDGTIDKQGKISVDGSGSSDSATVNAAGYVGLTTNASNQVETLNLSGNGAAVQYAITGAASTYNLTGEQSVTLAGASAAFAGKTVADTTTAGATAVKLTTLDNADLSKVATDKITVASNVASKTLTVADGANIELATDIDTAFSLAGKAADATVNVTTADDTNASGAAIDIVTGTFTANTNIKTLNLDATVGKFTATSTVLASNNTAGTGATLNVAGSKDVALGTVTAKTVDASASTGKVTLTADGANTAKAITTGSGDDDITLDEVLKFSINAGNGANKITVTSVAAASSIATGSGADTILLNDADAIAVVTGAGDDTVTVGNVATDAIIVMGEGSGDKLAFTSTGDLDLTSNANFAVTGVETVDIAGVSDTHSVMINAAAFAQDNSFKLVGSTGESETLKVVNKGTTGATIDASGITFNSTQDANLTLEGAAKLADTITGSAKSDTIVATTGADVINGGAGVDTFEAANLAGATIEGAGTGTSVGAVINLGGSAITNTAILNGTGKFTADSVTSVGAGQTAYLFDASASTNSAVQQSLSSIENVVGTAGNDYIVASSAGSTITGGAGVDTMVGGASADTFSFAVADSGVTTGNVDVITGFVAGTDKLQFNGVTDVVSGQQTAVQAAVTALTAGSDATAIANAMANANTTDNGVSFATFEGNTYAFFEGGADASGATADAADDALIQLSGVTTAPTFAADVVA